MIWKRDEQPEEELRQGVRKMAEQSGGEVTIIGQGAKLEGTVVSAGSLRVDGQLKGSIQAEGDVLLSEQSVVDADIKAANVSVGGTFKGDIVVKGTAELARGGKIEGNITSKTLVIQEGGTFTGQSIMGSEVTTPTTPAAPAPAQPRSQPQQQSGKQAPAGDQKAAAVPESTRVP